MIEQPVQTIQFVGNSKQQQFIKYLVQIIKSAREMENSR